MLEKTTKPFAWTREDAQSPDEFQLFSILIVYYLPGAKEKYIVKDINF